MVREKLIALFQTFPNKEFTMNELEDIIGCSRTELWLDLSYLMQVGAITREKKDSVYRYKKNSNQCLHSFVIKYEKDSWSFKRVCIYCGIEENL